MTEPETHTSDSAGAAVYRAVKRAIATRAIEPGGKLNIAELAKIHSVSAIPVREALARLHAERLLVYEANKGYRVAPPATREDILKWQEARILIETAVASPLIAHATDEDVQYLKAVNKEISARQYSLNYEDYNFFIEQNALFHQRIISATKNHFIVGMYQSIGISSHSERWHEGEGVPDVHLIISEHEHIIHSIETRNVAEYTYAARQHIEKGFSRTLLAK
ncbi:GntR family transcriptional regulator [Rhodobacteraceae bacterium RKSG542]|uniref:GntR family transcriptional regulator n=1 Tax=Pseudovibrio flavus TaxID=2529854 RepID=UPI0012BC122A|nr:GntR family transcriptional regulator [Pseudovibrio flavus]MTI15898.1 GntR family transcriptional regulator [Pseudovibrio flavus]